jgi:transposase-like protein
MGKSKTAPREIGAQVRDEVKQREKAIMQRLMVEEREPYLDEHLDEKGNVFYERALLAQGGLLEDLRVPRTRSGGFYPAVLPGKRRASVDLGDLILIMFQCGVNTRKTQQVVESIYGTYYSHASIAGLARVAAEEIEAWRMRPLKNA